MVMLLATEGSPGWSSEPPKPLPFVPLGRLHVLPGEEHNHYFQLFLAAGGGPETPVQGSVAAELLQRTGLPTDLLHLIWELADTAGKGSLDLEGFCIVCRLAAHAQQAQNYVPMDEVAVANPARGPLFLEGYEPTFSNPPSKSFQRQELKESPPSLSSPGGFDFEAAAFGADTATSGPMTSGMPTRPFVPKSPPVPPISGPLSAKVAPGVGMAHSTTVEDEHKRIELQNRKSTGEVLQAA